MPTTMWVPSLPSGCPGRALVRFATAPAEVNLGVLNPAQFVGATAKAVQAVYVNGKYSSPENETLAALILVDAQASGTGSVHRLASPNQLGSIWGLSYDRRHKRLFAAALAKRHSAFGPVGSGGIYTVSMEGLRYFDLYRYNIALIREIGRQDKGNMRVVMGRKCGLLFAVLISCSYSFITAAPRPNCLPSV